MRNKLIILLTVILFSLTFTTNGQKLVNSPFSRFNIGSLDPSGSFKSQGMGGLSVSMRDNSSIFYSNPASYSSFDTLSFIFDFGIDYAKAKLTEGESSYSSQDMNFDHLLLGFPLAKGWGFAAGIVPLSNGYYRMSESVLKTDPGYNLLVGEYNTQHNGDGSLTNAFLGTGVKLTRNLSVGINMKILFGKLQRTNQFEFTDFNNVYNNNTTEMLQLGGINFDYGLQYTVPFKNKTFINAGVSLTSGKNYKSNYEYLQSRYTAYTSKDTISYVSENAKSAFIPGTLRLGVSFGKINKFTAGLDFISTKWSKSKIPGSSGYAADTKSFLFGLEFIPDKYSNYSFLKRMEYRLGGHVEDNYLIVNGEQVKEVGASFGIGIPMRRTSSKTNLFFDFTRKSGSAVNNLHTQNYYTFGISLNLYDNWFIKRKYD